MNLESFFKENPKVALAFSGGVDSAYLLYAALKYAKNVKAYFVKSQFQPEFELQDAKNLANQLGADMKIINVDILKITDVVKNPKNRCYYCKKEIFENIKKAAKMDGYDLIIDGTNASDDVNDRPGIKALEEMKVLSPLRICNLTKKKIRELSKKAGLFTYDKVSYACLATRIKQGQTINQRKLEITEKSEEILKEIGFKDFRIRMIENTAKIQVKEKDMMLILKNRKYILNKLKQYYDDVLLDLEER